MKCQNDSVSSESAWPSIDEFKAKGCNAGFKTACTKSPVSSNSRGSHPYHGILEFDFLLSFLPPFSKEIYSVYPQSTFLSALIHQFEVGKGEG